MGWWWGAGCRGRRAPRAPRCRSAACIGIVPPAATASVARWAQRDHQAGRPACRATTPTWGRSGKGVCALPGAGDGARLCLKVPVAHSLAVGRPPRRLSQDWIIDESWWGDDDGFAPAPFAPVPPEPGSDGGRDAADCGPAAAPGSQPAPGSTPLHRELHVYLGASTYLLVPVEHASDGSAAGQSSTGVELLAEALVVPRNPPHRILQASRERVQFLKAHARDVLVAQGVLGIVQLEWEAFLVLLTASQAVTRLPQGELRRVTDAKILPIGMDNVGVHWQTGAVLSSPHGMLPSGSSAPGDWASVLAKRSFMLRSFKDMLRSGWMLMSWDFDCSRNQQTLASIVQRSAEDAAAQQQQQAAAALANATGTGGASTGVSEESAGGEEGHANGRAAGQDRGGASLEPVQDGGTERGEEPSYKGRVKQWCEHEGGKRGWDMRFVWNATWLEPLLRSARTQVRSCRGRVCVCVYVCVCVCVCDLFGTACRQTGANV